jgi:uncharacterized membrane protein YccC
VQDVVKTWYVQLSQIVNVVCILVSLLVFGVNVRRTKILYFTMGILIIVVIFINQVFHFKVYRDAMQIR